MVSIVTGRCIIGRSILLDVRRNNVLLRTNGILPQLNNITISDSCNKDISQLQGCGDCMLLQSRGFSGFSRKLDSEKYRKCVRNGFSAVLFPSHSGLRNSHQYRCASGDTSHYYTTTDFFPVKLAQDYTLAVHDFTGLPWWASIILCTVMLRTVITLPLFIVAQRNIARYANVNKDMVEVSEVLKAEVFHFSRNKNLSLQETKNLYSQQVKKQLTKKIEEHNCHPARSFLVGMIQLPAWMSMSCAVRNLCGHSYGTIGDPFLSAKGITDGGILWFADLSVPDPLFILPCLMGMTNLILTEMHWLSMDSKITSKPLGMRIMHNSFRIISVWLMYVATTMPSGLVLYWLTSSMFGAIQYVVLQQPRLRRAVRIPKIDGESTTPVKDIAKAARIKYFRQKD